MNHQVRCSGIRAEWNEGGVVGRDPCPKLELAVVPNRVSDVLIIVLNH
jgi:hypothetical protein